MDENYTINDDLRACGLPGDNKDDVAAGAVPLVGSSAAPVNVDAAGAGGTIPPSTPSSTPTTSTGTSVRKGKRRSAAWNDFEELFQEGANRKKSQLQFHSDGSIINWEYKPDLARKELCRLIARLDLPLGFGNAKEDYLSVVAHFVSADWELEKRVIALRLIDCSHSGVNIAELKSGLKRIKAYLEAFRTAISFLNSSNQRIAAFHKICIVKGVRPRKFGLDMDVRWNSTYLMLKHLLPYKNVFSVFISAHYVHNGQPLLTENHWVIAEKILLFLEIFYDSPVALSGVYYPTSPLMLHHIIEIAGHLHGQDSDPLLRNIVVPMKLKFLKYWQNIPLLYSFAFILDPRAKVRGFHNVLQLLSQTVGVDYSSYFTEVRTQLHKLFNKYENKFGAVRSQRPAQPSAATGKKRTAWGKIFGGPGTCGSPVLSSTPPISPASELSSYLESDTITCYDDDFNILSWWHEHKLSYPILSILAKDVMSVPVSTVSSESCCSLTGRVIEERRRRLLPETVEMLTCLKDWELEMQEPNMMLRRRSMNWRKVTKAPTQTWMKAKLVSKIAGSSPSASSSAPCRRGQSRLQPSAIESKHAVVALRTVGVGLALSAVLISIRAWR
ncbi:zinc finger BED domain-containing protein RICESLEEPER 2-like [Setaria viridis]|uniref:zinc finger BED domain-containing protein RICESLEEPER 2-like n=1 Tax=Setaria viridis TaxID=4556 RepID=UPI003B3B48B3